MNYLLFVYYNIDIENSEEKTQNIAESITDRITSGQVKFIYGDKHAIFHFASKSQFDDVSDVLGVISDDIQGFEYLLIKKGRDYSSNLDEDNITHLMSLRDVKPKKHRPTPPRLRTNNIDGGEMFMDLADLFLKHGRSNVCNLTLDELLDKINMEGMDSLSEIEKQKLDEYSKSL